MLRPATFAVILSGAHAAARSIRRRKPLSFPSDCRERHRTENLDDKGKPPVREGRKATGLFGASRAAAPVILPSRSSGAVCPGGNRT